MKGGEGSRGRQCSRKQQPGADAALGWGKTRGRDAPFFSSSTSREKADSEAVRMAMFWLGPAAALLLLAETALARDMPMPRETMGEWDEAKEPTMEGACACQHGVVQRRLFIAFCLLFEELFLRREIACEGFARERTKSACRFPPPRLRTPRTSEPNPPGQVVGGGGIFKRAMWRPGIALTMWAWGEERTEVLLPRLLEAGSTRVLLSSSKSTPSSVATSRRTSETEVSA